MSEVSLLELKRAIGRLEEMLTIYLGDPSHMMARDSLIKRFEFTYEIAQSTLKKFVETYSVNLKDRERLTLPTLIRTASQDGLLKNGWDYWHRFREARNRTSHTYNEDQAIAVVEQIPDFLAEVRFLARRMEEELPHE